MADDLKSPLLQCPPTVTVRRNPPRRAKTPAATITTTPKLTTTTKSAKSTVKIPKNISVFPLQDILECQIAPPPPLPTSPNPNSAESLRVFLRIKPLITPPSATNAKRKPDPSRLQPTKKKSTSKKVEIETCLVVNDSQSVTLSPPLSMQDAKRLKSEVYDGFTHVFDSESTQIQVYEKVMEPLVLEFLQGKSGMVTAMGPTGSGKTHTIFGSPRCPGMLSLTLGHLFRASSSSYYISMFEIYSERGKGEKLIDLSSSDGPDLSLQQSNVKGLKEVLVSSVVEAEATIACGMLKRATAMTNSNSQSSRSQCIINIRGASEVTDAETEISQNNPLLTIVDLAGAEREKKTGNQGTRLLESNFINNTSMVFGHCLRSLLEHQKNPKKPLQKHFQNSLLTKYLRDYLEGKKRMALILTVKPGGDDYLDASFLLRQASPYMKIKFSVVEEPCQKRNISKVPREEKPKRRKLSDPDAYMIHQSKTAMDRDPTVEADLLCVPLQQIELLNGSAASSPLKVEDNDSAPTDENHVELERLKRNEIVMQKFSKALWNVLKQYKKKLEESEDQVHALKGTLEKSNARNVELESEIESLKSHSLSFIQDSTEAFSAVQLAVDSCSPNVNAPVSHQGRDDTTSTQCRQSILQQESSGAVVDSSNFISGDTKLIDNQSDESSTLNGDGAKYVADELVEITDKPVSSGTKLVLIEDVIARETDSENLSPCKSLTDTKPRRRLLPASSILLREINNFDLEDEAEKPIGGKAGKRAAPQQIGRTQGSASLLKLLNNLQI